MLFLRRRWASGGGGGGGKALGVVTQHRSNKLWLESPVNLKQASLEQVQTLHNDLKLGPSNNGLSSLPAEVLIRDISKHSFDTAKLKMASATSNLSELSQEEVEEVRALIAMAVFHDNDEAKLFAANLLLTGAWPQTPAQSITEPAEKEDEKTARQRGMSVIKEIRKMQKANRLGYSKLPPKDLGMALGLLRTISNENPAIKAQALVQIGDLRFFPDDDQAEGKSEVLPLEEEALTAYAQAAELGAKRALYRLACAQLELGQAEQALASFERAAREENDADAHLYLAHEYKERGGEDATAAAREHLNAAIALGNTDAMVYLAKWELERGNEYEAVQLLVRAAKEDDNSEAMHLLADAHVDGSLGLDIDLPRAITLYCKSGQSGQNAQAWLSAGALALQVLDNDQFAFDCYTKATECASEGGEVHNEAWRRLAHLYMAGKGVEKNEETGRRILNLIGEGEEKAA